VRRLFAGWVPETTLHDAELIVSELVTNSLEHTDSRRIRLHASVRRGSLALTIGDDGPGLPAPRSPAGWNGRTLGLHLASALSSG
jgi:anti-sigma regulatory factor (Ser/Thr protein kinase)